MEKLDFSSLWLSQRFSDVTLVIKPRTVDPPPRDVSNADAAPGPYSAADTPRRITRSMAKGSPATSGRQRQTAAAPAPSSPVASAQQRHRVRTSAPAGMTPSRNSRSVRASRGSPSSPAEPGSGPSAALARDPDRPEPTPQPSQQATGPASADAAKLANLPEGSEVFPAHVVVLITTSEYFKRYFDSWHSEHGSRVVSIEVEPDEVPAAKLMLRYMYTGQLPLEEEADPSQLLRMIKLADQFSVTRFLSVCNSALADLPLEQLSLDHVAAILAMPPFLLEGGEGPGPPAGSAAGAQQQQQAGGSQCGGALAVARRRAEEKLAQVFGDLEGAWFDPARRQDFLRLPLVAVKYLLGRTETAVFSENTILVALTDWIAYNNRPQPAAPAAAAAQTAQLGGPGAEVDATVGGGDGGGGGVGLSTSPAPPSASPSALAGSASATAGAAVAGSDILPAPHHVPQPGSGDTDPSQPSQCAPLPSAGSDPSTSADPGTDPRVASAPFSAAGGPFTSSAAPAGSPPSPSAACLTLTEAQLDELFQLVRLPHLSSAFMSLLPHISWIRGRITPPLLARVLQLVKAEMGPPAAAAAAAGGGAGGSGALRSGNGGGGPMGTGGYGSGQSNGALELLRRLTGPAALPRAVPSRTALELEWTLHRSEVQALIAECRAEDCHPCPCPREGGDGEAGAADDPRCLVVESTRLFSEPAYYYGGFYWRMCFFVQKKVQPKRRRLGDLTDSAGATLAAGGGGGGGGGTNAGGGGGGGDGGGGAGGRECSSGGEAVVYHDFVGITCRAVLGEEEFAPLTSMHMELSAARFNALGEQLSPQRADVPGFIEDEVPYGVYDFFRQENLCDASQLAPFACRRDMLHLSCKITKCA